MTFHSPLFFQTEKFEKSEKQLHFKNWQRLEKESHTYKQRIHK